MYFLQALFDVDEVYTLEERIEQDEDNKESLGKKKKKKKKNMKFPGEDEPPFQCLKVKAIDQTSSALTSLSEVSSPRRVSCCEKETDSMDIDGSGSHKSHDDHSIINNQPCMEGVAACKKEKSLSLRETACEFHPTHDHPVTDLAMDSPEEGSLLPSAKALSTALQAAHFSVGYHDDSSLTVNNKDTLSHCCPGQYGGSTDAKTSVNTVLLSNLSNSGATETESTMLTFLNDYTAGEHNISSVITNVEVIDEEGTKETRGVVIFAEEIKDNDDNNLGLKDGGHNDRSLNFTDLKFSPSKVSEAHIISVDTYESEFSGSEGSTPLAATENEERTYKENVKHCSKMTGVSIDTKDNSDVTVGDREGDDGLKEEQKVDQSKEGENVDKTRKECGENTDSSLGGKLSAQEEVSEEGLPEVDEKAGAKCDVGEGEENENGWSRHVLRNSGCTDNVEVALSGIQSQNIRGKTREMKDESWDVCLEHGTLKQVTSPAGTTSQLLLNATEPLKGVNENACFPGGSCKNTHPSETPHSFSEIHAKEEATKREAVKLPETARVLFSRTNDNLADEEKSLFELQGRQSSESSLKMEAGPADSCGDTNRTLDPSSSSFSLVSAEEGHPFCPIEEANTSLVGLDGTAAYLGDVQRHVRDRALNEFSKCVDINHDALEDSVVGTSKVSPPATNNLNEEKNISDSVAPKAANSLPSESVQASESQVKTNETISIDTQYSALASEQARVSGHSFSSYHKQREFQQIFGNEFAQLNVVHSLSENEPPRNVKELSDYHQMRTSQTEQAEKQFSVVETTNTYSEPKEDKVCNEGGAKGFETSLGNQAESPIGILSDLPEKENDVKNESRPLESFQKGKNLNSEELRADVIKKFEDKDTTSNKGAEVATIKIHDQSDHEKDHSLRETIDETKECVTEDDREEGEISSQEDNTLENEKPKGEEKEEGEINSDEHDILEDGKPKRIEKERGEIICEDDNILEDEKPTREEKEEGELSSSDSDAEALTETSHVKQDRASVSKVVQEKNVLKRKEKEFLPTRRHSSSEVHRKLSTEESSQLPESSRSQRRVSSSVLQNIDLRTKLCEVRNKRISLESKTFGMTEMKVDRSHSGSRSFEKGIEKQKNSNVKRRSGTTSSGKGKEVQAITKDGYETRLKESIPKQSSQLKRRETLKQSRESGSNQSRHVKAGGSCNSVSKTKGKPIGSSKGDGKEQQNSPRGQKIGDRPKKRQCDVKETNRESTAFREANGKKLSKTPCVALQRESKEEKNNSKAKRDKAAVDNKDHLKSGAKKTSKVSRAAMLSKAKTGASSNSNTENNSPFVNECLKNKTKGHQADGDESKFSVDRTLKPQSESEVTRKNGKFQTHSLASGNVVDKGSEQDRSAVLSPRGKAQSKPRTKSVSASTVGKGDPNEKSITKQAKTAVKVSSRITPRKVPKKSPANIASKNKIQPRRGYETRSGNPRKRSRSADSTEVRQDKKLRHEKANDLSSKLPIGSSATKMVKSSIRSSQCNSNRENQPPSSKIKISGNKMVPVAGEKLVESTDKLKCRDDCKNKFSEVESIQTKPVLIGRNKCLVFKRRHVNQLFVRGDNVVMIAYAK